MVGHVKHAGRIPHSAPDVVGAVTGRGAVCTAPGRAADHVDDLLVQIAHGSRDALAELYDLLAPMLLELLRTRLPDAEDPRSALVDVFTRVWQQAPSYPPGPHGLDWVLDRAMARAPA